MRVRRGGLARSKWFALVGIATVAQEAAISIYDTMRLFKGDTEKSLGDR